MSESLVTGVLCAVAGALAGKAVSILLARRNGNGNGHGRTKLMAAREMADLTASVEDLMERTAGLESSLTRLWKELRRHGD